MIEKIYYSDLDFIEIDLPEQGHVGVMMSGGADSSLLAFLLANSIKKNGLKTKVFPVTAELLSRPYNIKHSVDVVAQIQTLTDFLFEIHLCFCIPNHQKNMSDKEKIDTKSKYTSQLSRAFQLQTLFNGLTTNPPESVLPSGPKSHRPSERDTTAWKLEMKSKPGLSVPFIDIDKSGIAKLYKKFNLIESLLPLTRSCEGEFLETECHTKNCFQVRAPGKECYWCREKEYGFSNVI